MKLDRRTWIAAACGMAATGIRPAWAQDFPSKPLRIVVPFPPTGSNDVLGRLMGQKLGEAFGQSAVIENKAGAGGNIGAEFVARSPADGHTMLVSANSIMTMNPVLYVKLPFDPVVDFAPVTLLGTLPLILVVNPNVKAQSVTELIALAKKEPGKLTYASAGTGTPQHMAAELFQSMTGIKMTHVPYRGGAPALVDILSGTVDMMFAAITSALPLIRAGKLRVLGAASTKRVSLLPDAPLISEFVPGYTADGWIGMLVPAKTPAPVVARLNTELHKALAMPDVKATLAEQGIEVAMSTPVELASLIAAEQKRWAAVVKSAGIQPQ